MASQSPVIAGGLKVAGWHCFCMAVVKPDTPGRAPVKRSLPPDIAPSRSTRAATVIAVGRLILIFILATAWWKI
jgi:hypothetical protein